MHEKKLEDYSWDEIAEISASGKAEKTLCVGDEKTETLSTGEKVTFVIIGFNHDELETGGKAGITFGLKGVLNQELEMNDDDTNVGGWRKCKMRTVHLPRIFNQLPSSLSKNIKTVIKETGKGEESEELEQTADKLFLFSEVELYGFPEDEELYGTFDFMDDSDAAPREGTRYEYFKNRKNYAKTGNGGPAYWWLRSPFLYDDKFFCYIASYGSIASFGARHPTGVSFGFCI